MCGHVWVVCTGIQTLRIQKIVRCPISGQSSKTLRNQILLSTGHEPRFEPRPICLQRLYTKLSSFYPAATAAKSRQSCPTLCNPIDGSPTGSSVPGIPQTRTLEWVAISFSSAWKWKVKVKSLSHVWLLVTPWTVAYQAPPSMGFSRQEYWSELPLPSPPSILTLAKLLHAGRSGRGAKKTQRQFEGIEL